jgi:biofilm PGA synthesis protein PgaD
MTKATKDPTFDVASMASKRLRSRDALLTTIMWLIYAYLWLPMISLAAWLVGLDFAYDKVLEAGGLAGLAKITRWYGIAALIIMLFVIGWSVSQRLRFKGKDRRAGKDSVAPEVLREEAGLRSEDFVVLRGSNDVSISFDTDGAIAGVRPQ